MGIPEKTELRQMEIERDNALGLARGLKGEVQYLKNEVAEHRQSLEDAVALKAKRSREGTNARLAVAKALDAMTGERDSLKVELKSMKAERDRWRKEAKRLQRKVVTLQDAASGITRPEKCDNHFDQHDHYREM